MALKAAFGGTSTLGPSVDKAVFEVSREDATIAYTGALVGWTRDKLRLQSTVTLVGAPSYVGPAHDEDGDGIGDVERANIAFDIYRAEFVRSR